MEMDDSKKMRLHEIGNGQLVPNLYDAEDLRALLAPLAEPSLLARSGVQLKEALQLQLDVQRRLHEQLETQRNLQLRIEEQGEQLKRMLEQQQNPNVSPTLEVLVSEGSDDNGFPININ